MRIAHLAVLPLAALSASASLADSAFNWAADALSKTGQLKPSNEVHTFDGWKWSDCGMPTDVVEIHSITLNPDPPQPGKKLTVTVEGTANEVLEEGAYADVTVKLGLIKLLQKRFDVCEEARNANASIQCPVQEGDYTVVQTVDLPEEIPRAKFVVNVRAYTADDDDVACVDLVVDFTPPPEQIQ